MPQANGRSMAPVLDTLQVAQLTTCHPCRYLLVCLELLSNLVYEHQAASLPD